MKKHILFFLTTAILFPFSLIAQEWHESFDNAKTIAADEQKKNPFGFPRI